MPKKNETPESICKDAGEYIKLADFNYPNEPNLARADLAHALLAYAALQGVDKMVFAGHMLKAILTYPGWDMDKEELKKKYFPEEVKSESH